MASSILEGTAECERILNRVGFGIRALAHIGKVPCLAAIQANDDPGADWYARAQEKHCLRHGILHKRIRLPANASEDALADAIRSASADPGVSGIILFTPLPAGVDEERLIREIDPAKDAEGVHPLTMGRLLVSGRADPAPCTAMAALELIKSAKPDLSGARALVIGRSRTVGKPLALLLLAENATVTVAHTKSDLRAAMIESDVVVAAAGASGARWRAYERAWLRWREGGGEKPPLPHLEPLVTMDMVRRGAVVVDVGDNSIPVAFDGEGKPVVDDMGLPRMRYAGDVDFEKVREVAGFITRPRGSVGPLTNAFLLWNVTHSALRLAGLEGA